MYALNTTGIITNKSISDECFKEGSDHYFCSRYVSITIIAIFTGFLCIGKIAKYHYNKVKCGFQLTIFYCALGECICFSLHWVALSYVIVENLGYWFRVMQLLAVCYLYTKLASRVIGRDEQIYRKWCVPGLAFFTLYYIALVPWIFLAPKFDYPNKCTEFWHPCYTISDFLLSLVFTMCGFYLTRKMASVRMPSEQLMEQKKQLWGVIIAFEVEAVVSIVYDILLGTIGKVSWGCGVFLYQHNVLSVIVFVIVRSLRLFVAIWFMLYTFDAQSTDYSNEHDQPQYDYADEDSFDAYMASHRNSIVPYARDTSYDVREPLINENTFENYFPEEDLGARFGDRTHRKMYSNGQSSSG